MPDVDGKVSVSPTVVRILGEAGINVFVHHFEEIDQCGNNITADEPGKATASIPEQVGNITDQNPAPTPVPTPGPTPDPIPVPELIPA
jgi:hypothetical protein